MAALWTDSVGSAAWPLLSAPFPAGGLFYCDRWKLVRVYWSKALSQCWHVHIYTHIHKRKNIKDTWASLQRFHRLPGCEIHDADAFLIEVRTLNACGGLGSKVACFWTYREARVMIACGECLHFSSEPPETQWRSLLHVCLSVFGS